MLLTKNPGIPIRTSLPPLIHTKKKTARTSNNTGLLAVLRGCREDRQPLSTRAQNKKKKPSLERRLRPGSAWRRRRDLNPCAGFPTYSLSRGAPSPLGYFSMVNSIKNYLASDSGIYKWRRGRDSNSWSLAGSLVFKTSSLNHSDTSPRLMLVYDIIPFTKSQQFFLEDLQTKCFW